MAADIRKGFVTQLGMALEEAFAHAAQYGFDYVEVMMDGDHERTKLVANKDDVLTLQDEHDMGVLVHLPFQVDIAAPQGHVRDGSITEIKAAIDAANQINAEKGVLHASSHAWSAAWDVETIQERLLDAIQDLHEYGDDSGFTVAVENVPNAFFDIYDFPILFEETDAQMTLDTGHARMEGMDSDDIAVFIEEHADRIAHLHLNDSREPADEHLPFGAGNLDFAEILAPLKTGWTGTLSIEAFTHNWDYMALGKEQLDAII